jgi:hypothetical protein
LRRLCRRSAAARENNPALPNRIMPTADVQSGNAAELRVESEGSKMSERTARTAVYAGLAGVFLGQIAWLNFPDPDIFHAMALFRESLARGWVPTQELFAYTPTVDPSLHHEWGTGALLYLVTVSAGFGAGGLMALKYLLAGSIAAGCVVCARRRGAADPMIALLAPVAILLGWIGFTTIRAQHFTLFFLVALLLLLESDRRGRRWWIAAWLPLYVVWVNMHAGFVVGAGIFGLYSIERFAREFATCRSLPRAIRSTSHLLLAGGAMTLLPLINPYGAEYLPYLWHSLRLERPRIAEWKPLWFRANAPLVLTMYGLSLAAIAYAGLQRGMARLPGLAIVLTTAVLALQHMRHSSLYAVVWLCLVPAWLTDTEFARGLQRAWRAAPQLAAALALLLGTSGTIAAVRHEFWALKIPTSESSGPLAYPAGAVDYLARQGFSGNVMTPFRSGSFVSWKLHPAVKVSFDGRYEAAYPPEALEENFAFYGAKPGWRATLDRYPTDAVLVPRGSPLDGAMEQLAGVALQDAAPHWCLIYRDDGFSLFVRGELARRLPAVDRTGERLPGTFP